MMIYIEYFQLKIQPGIVLSNIQASRPAMKTGLAMNMDIVLSTPSFPVIEKNRKYQVQHICSIHIYE